MYASFELSTRYPEFPNKNLMTRFEAEHSDVIDKDMSNTYAVIATMVEEPGERERRFQWVDGDGNFRDETVYWFVAKRRPDTGKWRAVKFYGTNVEQAYDYFDFVSCPVQMQLW